MKDPQPLATIPERIRLQFAMGIRWPNGPSDMPQIVCFCKKCGAIWFAQNVYDLMRWVQEHMDSFPCQATLIGNEISNEVEKVLKALERAE